MALGYLEGHTSHPGLASGNRRRAQVLNHVGLRPEIIAPLNPEPRTSNPAEIARNKADEVIQADTEHLLPLVIAADSVLSVRLNGQTETLFKPEELQEVRTNLTTVAKAGSYQVKNVTVLGSQVGLENEVRYQYFPLGTTITLSRYGQDFLQTEQGWEAYQRMFTQLYGEKVTPFKVGGGICALVLTALGVVETIDGVTFNPNIPNSDALDAIYGMIFTTVMNFSPAAVHAAIHHLTKEQGLSGSKPTLSEVIDDLLQVEEVLALRENVVRLMPKAIVPYLPR